MSRVESFLNKMREDWNRRARENAYHYINTARENWDPREFFETGNRNVAEQVLNDMEGVCRGKPPKVMRVLEIGCGGGRLTRALAATFGEVHGVDVSDEMISMARASLADLPNVHLHLNNGADLAGMTDHSFDFAFSFLVFQHISSREVIESYVREVCRVLRPESLFKFQLQGYAETQPEADDTWIGAPYTIEQATKLANDCGFELRDHHGVSSQYFWLWFLKP